MSEPTASSCPACGAPLPEAARGLLVLCPWCRCQVQLGAPAPTRQFLLVDRSDRAEAAALLAQHLARRFPVPTAVRTGGQTRLAPFWSVVTPDGELHVGPATREEPELLARVTLPALPARPLTPTDTLPVNRCPADVPLEAFLAPPAETTPDKVKSRDAAAAAAPDGAPPPQAAAAPPPAVERAWLIWVPVRFWQVRVGGHLCPALTVADATLPVLGPVPEAASVRRPRWRALAPLAAYALALAVLGRLLPLRLHVPAAAALLLAATWTWRTAAPARAPARSAEESS